MKYGEPVRVLGHLAAGLAPRRGWRRRGASPAAKWGIMQLALLAVAAAISAHAAAPAREIDVRRAEAAGLRVLEGKYVRLVTDLPSSAAVDELPAVFDAAVPLWAAYFDVPAAKLAGARWVGFVVEDREKFAVLGLMTTERPDFQSGYAHDWEFWLAEQPSDYYRRHLMLHEGTHAFMQAILGGAGPPWYMEGMAELLGTHEWRDGKLRLGVMPASREDVPMWGRVKLIRDAAAANQAWPLERVLAVDNVRGMTTDEYAWAWGLCALLDGHPGFQKPFRELRGEVTDPRFTERFKLKFLHDWGSVDLAWQAFVAEVDYGYDITRMESTFKMPELAGDRLHVKLHTDRGWQTAWNLRAGATYRISANGRYQIADDGTPWPCEPDGVTIDYYHGKPLGAVVGALMQGRGVESVPSFVKPLLIGREATITPEHDGVLFVRVNESPAKLGDNKGEVALTLELLKNEPAHSEVP